MIKAIKRRMLGACPHFMRDGSGSVAVETAFIVPIYITIAIFAFEAVAYVKMAERSDQAFYAIGDVISNQRGAVNCVFLDNLAQLGYDMYRYGNWSSSDKEGLDYTNATRGELSIWMLAATIQPKATPTALAKGTVNWEFRRTGAASISLTQAVSAAVIPNEYYSPGEQLLVMRAQVNSKPPLNLLGLWGSSWSFDSGDKFMNPRHVDSIPFSGPATPDCRKW
jgi:hypothetical protein